MDDVINCSNIKTYIKSINKVYDLEETELIDKKTKLKKLVTIKKTIKHYLVHCNITYKQAKQLEKIYDKINNKIEKLILHVQSLFSKTRDYIYYPDIIDSFFNDKIYKKKEFNINELESYTEKQIELRKKDENFKPTNTQSFIKTYMSNHTPYNGLLLWHGVGVGKTCGAISIAENFKNKDIEILLPSNTLKQNWKDEIINIRKEFKKKKDSIVQCTGNTYTDQIDIQYWKKYLDKTDTGEYNLDNLRLNKRINQLISEQYTFTTYMTLANSIEKEFIYSKKVCKNSLRKDIRTCTLKDPYSLNKYRKLHYNEQIQYIKNRFSNKVFIMDEIHQTRSNKISETDSKKIRPYLEMIARYADNTHFILLSATPMYNITNEIIWVLNLLLWNDDRGPISHKIFSKNKLELKSSNTNDRVYDNNKQILLNKSRGYISFLRGENPFTFPIKLPPLIEGTPESTYFVPTPKKYIYKKQIFEFDQQDSEDSDTCFTYINPTGIPFLYPDILSDWQYTFINNELEKNLSIDLSSSSLLSKYSNIIYPQLLDSNVPDDSELGTMNDVFEEMSAYKYNYTNKEYPCMKPELLQTHSIKMYNIIHCISNSLPIRKKGYTSGDSLEQVQEPGGGIIFIYSKFINYGVKPMTFALEELGFNRYVLNEEANYMEKNLLIRKRNDDESFCAYNKCRLKDIDQSDTEQIEHFKKTFTQARYVYLDGSIQKNMLNHLVKESRGEGLSNKSNHYGENIMVILGTGVVEVGLSFFNVRQIHILEPWYHFNAMVQVVGRGSRNFSHKHLDKEYRNIMIYLHVATRKNTTADNDRIELSDERLYRESYCKKTKMINVELLLKENAIDCQLNIKGNIFIENTSKSDGTPETNYYDKGSMQRDIYDSIGSYATNLPVLRNKNSVGDEDYSLGCNLRKCRDFTCNISDSIANDSKQDVSTFIHSNNNKNINQAKILLKKIFKKKHYYELNDILKIIKKDPSFFSHSKDSVEDKDKIIFSALNEIITQQEDIYYKKNNGYLIMRQYKDYDEDDVDDVDDVDDDDDAEDKIILSFYIFQPKIINKSTIKTYSSIHTTHFQKEYNRIIKLIQSTNDLKLLTKYNNQKNKLFKKFFLLEDTSLPIKYRDFHINKNNYYYLPKMNFKQTIKPISSKQSKQSKDDGQIATKTSKDDGQIATKTSKDDGQIATKISVSSVSSTKTRTSLKTIKQTLHTEFSKIIWYVFEKKIKKLKTKIPKTEHLLTIVRYNAIDNLTYTEKRDLLQEYLRTIILIDDISTISVDDSDIFDIDIDVTEDDELFKKIKLYKQLQKIYTTYHSSKIVNNYLFKLVKKIYIEYNSDTPAIQLLKQLLSDEDRWNWITLQNKIIIYMKYDYNIARVLLGKLRDIPHIITEYNHLFRDDPFKQEFNTSQLVINKKKYMGNLYSKPHLQKIMYLLLLIEYFDQNNNLYNGENNNYNIIRNRRDLKERAKKPVTDESNEIIGFIIRFNPKKGNKEFYYQFNSNTKTFSKPFNVLRTVNNPIQYLQYNKFIQGKNILIGFNMYNSKKKKNIFKLLDSSIQKEVTTKTGKVNKKFVTTGVVCGSGNFSMRIPNLKKHVETILGITFSTRKQYMMKINIDDVGNKTQKNIKVTDLCNILATLLNYKEHESMFKSPISASDASDASASGASASATSQDSISDSTRWFYNSEEALYLTF